METEKNRIKELIKSLQSGNKKDFDELYKLTAPKVYFIACKICRNEHDAKDILQETYITVLEKIDTIDPEKNFTAWLYQVAANKSKNLLKFKKHYLLSEDETEIIENLSSEDLLFNPEEQVDLEELKNEVMAAIDKLSDEKRACIILMYFANLSVNEIAQSLDLSVSTVKNRLFAARKSLKKSLENKESTAIYSAAPLGLIIWALDKTYCVEEAAFATSSASATLFSNITSSAATNAALNTTTAATGTGIAAKTVVLSATQKIIVGVVAASVIGTGTAGVVTVIKNNAENTLHAEEVTTAPSQFSEYVFPVNTTDFFTEISTLTEKSETIEKPEEIATTSQVAHEKKTENHSSETKIFPPSTRKLSTTKIRSTTRKHTTTKKRSTTYKQTTTINRSTTRKRTTTRTYSTTKPITTVTEYESTTEEPITEEQTTETTTVASATIIINITDLDDNIVDTLTLSVEAGTELTWDYLITIISQNGYEATAGVYGDGMNAIANSGETYTFTAEL